MSDHKLPPPGFAELDIPYSASDRLILTLQRKVNEYGLALMMIQEGAADPRGVAARALAEGQKK